MRDWISLGMRSGLSLQIGGIALGSFPDAQPGIGGPQPLWGESARNARWFFFSPCKAYFCLAGVSGQAD